ncbi:ketosteroid isomerase [Terrihabitans soli]|uniref:Ketosteroid isomerase n=1 Tax=Terrihabitans soli TaxID=708113 RepID=A0A6S6QR33_9HYPH|nr:nuclear transport factor 2 family protein [Terrihabitans soli]BCJ90427.1 ketosteroid isomerase [Terrihabitans soli]
MKSAVLDWLFAWQQAINTRDYDGGALLFDEDVIAFGTYSDAMRGRSNLVDRQWREMWPYISNFRFAFEEMTVLGTEDALTVVICPWTSRGLAPDGSSFPRAGRCTIALKHSGDALLAVHTHFSMSKGSVARVQAA